GSKKGPSGADAPVKFQSGKGVSGVRPTRGYVSGDYQLLKEKVRAAKARNVDAIGEIETAKFLRSEGTNVHFQTPVGPRGAGTADFLVGGERGTGLGGAVTDVLTPITSKPGSVI